MSPTKTVAGRLTTGADRRSRRRRRSWSGASARQLSWLAPLVMIVLLIVAWQVVVEAFDIQSFLLPTPTATFKALTGDWHNLLSQAAVTLRETLIGFGLSAVVGIGFACIMVMWPLLGSAMFPILVASQVIPKVAVAPLMVVWIGTGVTTSSLIAFVMAFFPVVVNATLGMNSVEQTSVDLMRSMGSSKWQVFRYLRLPNALPFIMSGFQLAIAFAIVGAIVGEFVGSNAGLGYLLIVTQGNLQTDLLFADLVVLTALGLVLYYGTDLIGRFLLRDRK